MAIKRYTANADTTITNAFKTDLSTRATGSNMGASDSLEVFSIYGQSVSGSTQSKTTELSRVLVNFPIPDVVVDRAAGDIPASGSVSFYLRMFNAEHPFSVPSSFILSASAATADWEEGFGLDMEGYRDATKDGVGASWMNANGDHAAATLVDAIDTTGSDANDAFTMTVPIAAGGDGVAHKFTIVDTDSAVLALSDANGFGISQASTGGGVAATVAAAIIDAINGTVNAAVGYGGGAVGTVLAGGTLGVTASPGTAGASGNPQQKWPPT